MMKPLAVVSVLCVVSVAAGQGVTGFLLGSFFFASPSPQGDEVPPPIVVVEEARCDDSCPTALDGWCDEPLFGADAEVEAWYYQGGAATCAPGTDCSDCRGVAADWEEPEPIAPRADDAWDDSKFDYTWDAYDDDVAAARTWVADAPVVPRDWYLEVEIDVVEEVPASDDAVDEDEPNRPPPRMACGALFLPLLFSLCLVVLFARLLVAACVAPSPSSRVVVACEDVEDGFKYQPLLDKDGVPSRRVLLI